VRPDVAKTYRTYMDETGYYKIIVWDDGAVELRVRLRAIAEDGSEAGTWWSQPQTLWEEQP
jgi:hypothetical protein